MKPKPKHLGNLYATQFQEPSIVAAYHYRPPYPEKVLQNLASLAKDDHAAVLDIGCGTGYLARLLAPLFARVDAVDFSAAMIARGRTLPGGEAANLRWLEGPVETVPLAPPYGLITAGESLHWMTWDVVLPRLHKLLVPGAFLAIVNKSFSRMPWQQEMNALIRQYSTNQDFVPYDLIAELTERGLFSKIGTYTTAPMAFSQTVDAYINACHSTNGFSRERMEPDEAFAFDMAVRDCVTPFCPDGSMTIEVRCHIVWGRPLELKKHG